MKKNEELFWLINKLTPDEKRYFIKFTSLHNENEDPKYMQLFNEINRMKTPQELNSRRFLTYFQSVHQGRNFSDDKLYLINMITRAMRMYNENKSVDSQLFELAKDIQFFKEKEMWGLYYKTVLKAKKTALKYERYKRILEIGEEEMYYRVKFPTKSLDCDFKELLEAQEKNLDFLVKLQRLKNIKTTMFKKNLEKAGADQLLSESDAAFINQITEVELNSSFYLASYYYSIQYLINNMRNERKKAYEYSTKLIDLYIDYPHFKKEQENAYFVQLTNNLQLGIKAENLHEVYNLIQKIYQENLIPVNKGVFFEVLYAELYVLLNLEQLDDLDLLKDKIIHAVKQNEAILSKQTIIATFYQLAIAYLFKRDFDNVIYCAERVQNSDYEIKNRNYYKSRLIILIAILEKGEYETAFDMVRSIKRERDYKLYLKEVNTSFFNLISEILKNPSQKSKTKKMFDQQVSVNDEFIFWHKSI